MTDLRTRAYGAAAQPGKGNLQERDMNLNCPKCGSGETQRLLLVMDQGGITEKTVRTHNVVGANVALPIATLLFAVLFSMLFVGSSVLLAVLVFGGIMWAGFMLRRRILNASRSPYADLTPDMKQRGFRCNRCGEQFIPA
jgi:predicted RNA-binding Zn-ribbon protein involved in translation (DUF1610 family)